MTTLYIFRQDLRLHDNTALIETLASATSVLPIFIYDTRSIEDFGEEDPRFGLIREALEVIDTELQRYGGRLTVYRGDPVDIVRDLISRYPIDRVACATSYSPRGRERDRMIREACMERDVEFMTYQDYLIVEPQEIEVRRVFTPFSMLWKKYILAHPERLNVRVFDGSGVRWFVPEDRREIGEIISVPYHPHWTIEFGRARMERDTTHYEDLRNLPGVDGSTRLSPYLRFGIYSPREIYAKFASIILSETKDPEKQMHGFFLRQNDETTKSSETLISELIWREFWYHIAYYFPETYDLEFQERRRSIEWRTDTTDFIYQKFVQGETGYPLVDAAIRQLYETGWMHNRLRMVVASFLTKNLGYDWRLGEKWFKKYLIDYDEAVNIGNWQWSASVGADPKPVRIFNPLLQSERFDLECVFIKKYIPELAHISPKRIHTLDLAGVYHRPIVDQRLSAAEARERYSGRDS